MRMALYCSMRLVLCFGLFLIPLSIHSATDEELLMAYQRALLDAEVVESSEVFDNLIPIREDQPGLVWKEEPEGKYVLVVTFTSWPGYNDLAGKKVRVQDLLRQQHGSQGGNAPMGLYTATRDLWVTLVPEIKEFFENTNLRGAELELRAKQVLGLPHYRIYDRFVEFWVKPGDLFRPSPDQEISDKVAALDFPADVSESYKTWFNDLKAVQYDLNNGFPWTRLGYTYDWENPDREIGLSEYVIGTGATVDVRAVTYTADYLLQTSSAGFWSLYD